MVGRRGGFFFSSPDRLTTHSRRGAFDRRSRRFLEGLVEWNREFRCMYGVKEQEREEKKKKKASSSGRLSQSQGIPSPDASVGHVYSSLPLPEDSAAWRDFGRRTMQ